MGQVQFSSAGEFYVDLFEQTLHQRSIINGYWQFDQQNQILRLQGMLNGTLMELCNNHRVTHIHNFQVMPQMDFKSHLQKFEMIFY